MEKRRILVIDDDPEARDIIERLLVRGDFVVVTATSGEEGLRLAHELQPAAITLDVMMPDMDGWSVLRALKTDPALRDIQQAAPRLESLGDRVVLFAILAVVAAPFFEEWLFRGFVYGGMRRTWGAPRSVLASALLFAIVILFGAWMIGAVCEQARTAEYLVALTSGVVTPLLLPVLLFGAACLVSFATGTSWGTMAILIPTAVPIAFELDGTAYGMTTILTVAAVLDGAIFGDHCSPISDTTIMSSVGSACNHMAHVRTQLPYSLLVGVLAVGLGYVPVALGAGCWVGILGSVGVCGLLFWGLGRLPKNRTGPADRENIASAAERP